MNKESIIHFFRSRLFAGIAIGVAGTLIAVIIFEAGVAVGFHQAQFSSRWGANYERNFGGPHRMIGLDTQLPDPHGAFGQLVSTSSTTLTLLNPKKQEQKILLTKDTIIRDHETTLSANDLKNNMFIVVLGDPNDTGEVIARFIRIMPAPSITP